MWLCLLSSFFLNLSRAAALLSVKGFLVSLNCLIKGSRSFSSLLMSSFGEGESWLPKDQLVPGSVLCSHVAMARPTTVLLSCTSSYSHCTGGELWQEVKHDWGKFIHFVTALSEIHSPVSQFGALMTAVFHPLKAWARSSNLGCFHYNFKGKSNEVFFPVLGRMRQACSPCPSALLGQD